MKQLIPIWVHKKRYKINKESAVIPKGNAAFFYSTFIKQIKDISLYFHIIPYCICNYPLHYCQNCMLSYIICKLSHSRAPPPVLEINTTIQEWRVMRMWQRNDGISEPNIVQNRFTAYLTKSIMHSKIHYLRGKEKQQQYETSLEPNEYREWYQTEFDMLNKMPAIEQIENHKLQQALKSKNNRDLYILFSRTLKDQSFIEISEELGISYTAVKKVYYRMIEKIKKELEGEKK